MIDTDKTWLQVEVVVDANAAEAVEFALNELGALGTEINLLGIRPPQEIRVFGYFNEPPDEDNLRLQILESLRIYDFGVDTLKNIELATIENRDWLAEWKKHWKPTEVGKFIIAPPWEHVERADKIVIEIEPNMAFGTGTHETTQLCLKVIGKKYGAQQTFLDVGTGTGILAIAAAKLGGKTIFACDTDADSVKIARGNAVANGVDWIDFADGPLGDDAPVFDFVCANLTIDVIVPILPLLLEKTRDVLLLSGILAEQRNMIANEIRRSQISNFKFEKAGEWISVTIEKNPNGKAFYLS
jgi:ribosomal protein L11 methyltransferase